ncbi:outer membrane beta-barrel protein [Desulfofustis glycolicus]|uniref:Uncharacterized protein, PEP-CTERM system associated n=1 Tax=Desulfofustis glycolicus DSM 9705 TaxID=1121409 RepID=A0A1M5YLE4_9BACT|nr:outer membrane beta-barrel protein [Desulfofustis glycolicus]MCB2218515.1 outer membrane beta-barrel protein [Desulfobulbaceae bacterium]SHI12749.1 uncharacterized protein, PEP-CTERM system associated [Desulfofustis glycolicus DSM 9705]
MRISFSGWLGASSCLLLMLGHPFPAEALRINDLVVIAAADTAPASSGGIPDLPMGQGTSGEPSLLPSDTEVGDESDLFGIRGGYVHPYLSVGGEYTDNLYNLNEGEVSNMLWRISPGVWFSLPRTKQIPIIIQPHNTSPGGLQLQIDDYEGTDRYQAYALAGGDYLTYSENSDLNGMYGRLEGLFRYNMRGGLSLQGLDRFTYGQDRFEYGGETRDYRTDYISNIFMATADYTMTEKLRAKIDYSHFLLDYDDTINDFLDRADNSIDFYGYYLYSLKTSFFLQYRLTDVSYDTAVEKDNLQHYLYGGITWDTTEKLSLLFKAGYQAREYEDDLVAEQGDWDGLTLGFESLYRWTEKTQFGLDFYRKSEESDSAVALDKVVFGLSFRYRQEYTEKLSGLLNVMYEQAEYTQLVDTSRDDDRIYIRPAVRYLFREWLMAELAYVFDTRDSSDELFDYTSNTIIFNINLAL